MTSYAGYVLQWIMSLSAEAVGETSDGYSSGDGYSEKDGQLTARLHCLV